MFSLLINIKSRRTTLIFPNDHKLWTFFAMIEAPEFRMDSSKFLFTGKLQEKDIELAKQKLGASELEKEANTKSLVSRGLENLFCFTDRLRCFFLNERPKSCCAGSI